MRSKLGEWRLQWTGASLKALEGSQWGENIFLWVILGLLFACVFVCLFGKRKSAKGVSQINKFEWRLKIKDVVIVFASIAGLILFFVLAKDVSSDFLEKIGYQIPLPLFTMFYSYCRWI